jgi:hypothetical protein
MSAKTEWNLSLDEQVLEVQTMLQMKFERVPPYLVAWIWSAERRKWRMETQGEGHWQS